MRRGCRRRHLFFTSLFFRFILFPRSGTCFGSEFEQVLWSRLGFSRALDDTPGPTRSPSTGESWIFPENASPSAEPDGSLDTPETLAVAVDRYFDRWGLPYLHIPRGVSWALCTIRRVVRFVAREPPHYVYGHMRSPIIRVHRPFGECEYWSSFVRRLGARESASRVPYFFLNRVWKAHTLCGAFRNQTGPRRPRLTRSGAVYTFWG